MPSNDANLRQEAIGLKRLQLYPLAERSGRLEKRTLPGGSSAAVAVTG